MDGIVVAARWHVAWYYSGTTDSCVTVFMMRVTAPEGKRGEMLQALRTLVGPMSVKPGCCRCRLYQDTDDENVITWIEEWESREQLDRHVRSDEYRTLLSVMDMSTVQPEIRFDEVVPIAGMELIEDTRKTSGAKPERRGH